MESTGKFASLHHRIPAILEKEEDVDEWLNPNNDYRLLLKKFKPDADLKWHPVSKSVGSTSNQEPTLMEPVAAEGPKASGRSSQLMASWLATGPSSPSTSSQIRPPVKTSAKAKKALGIENFAM